MRIIITLIYLGVSLHLFGQTKGIEPAQQITQNKQKGLAFEKVQLFKQKPNKKNLANEALKSELIDFQVIELATEQLKKVYRSAPDNMVLLLPNREGQNFELELVKTKIFDDAFQVKLASSETPIEVTPGHFYRGIIKGESQSLVSFSIFEDEVVGVISSPLQGNWTVEKIKGQLSTQQYVIYEEKDRTEPITFECGTTDEGLRYSKKDLSTVPTTKTSGKCTRIYFEVDYDRYRDKASPTATTNFVTGIFNEVATLYANEGVTVKISEIFIWDRPSPYTGSSSSTMLNKFQRYRTSFDGDLAQLISYQASGGIAVLDGLCHPYNSAKMSFSSIGRSYRSIPDYSFTVMVVAHELGHLFGSHHTHACVWNGNNTAIDGCAGFVEGSCRNPGNPSGGGTIMSYCHINRTGINFSKGFGVQPGNVIRNNVANASCLKVCSAPGDNGGDSGNGNDDDPVADACRDNQVLLNLILDDFAMETTWKIKDANGNEVATGGPYKKGSRGALIRDTFCLKNGCYKFEMFDTYGDGICCEFGRGSYSLRILDGESLLNGADFGFSEINDFCLNATDEEEDPCFTVNFNEYNIEGYGGLQDQGILEVQDNGTTLAIANNAWKAIPLDYLVTPSTIIEFEFASTRIGEIHGIGFDDDQNISSSRTFRVYGFQNWGISNFSSYSGGGNWVKFKIPIGQFYSGPQQYLFFVSDHDSGQRNGNSYFRNVRIYESNSNCTLGNLEEIRTVSTFDSNIKEKKLEVSPNPTNDLLFVNVELNVSDRSALIIYNTIGEEVKRLSVDVVEGMNALDIDVSDLKSGTYVLKINTDEEELTKRFTVIH